MYQHDKDLAIPINGLPFSHTKANYKDGQLWLQTETNYYYITQYLYNIK